MDWTRKLIHWCIIYLMIGIVWGLVGEYRLATKYSRLEGNEVSTEHVLNRMLFDPYVYIRSILASYSWPVDMYWAIYHRSHQSS
jgi:hypothetical protein